MPYQFFEGRCLAYAKQLSALSTVNDDLNMLVLLLPGLASLLEALVPAVRASVEMGCRLEAHPRVRRAHYPGLCSHPDHHIARQQMRGFGGVVSFEVEGDLWATARVRQPPLFDLEISIPCMRACRLLCCQAWPSCLREYRLACGCQELCGTSRRQ